VARALRASWSEAQLIAFAKGVRLDVKALRRQLMATHPDDRVTATAE
jgi:hypothetical protein